MEKLPDDPGSGLPLPAAIIIMEAALTKCMT
ncbi:hypothetical protein J2Z18_005234 [Paenibacillus lactis]|uniref:Uncharacterized protein n=1 Tax=Paenibacillus lactis TaxID=228574 RepID=A0ABS4FIU4_9BACL|nr:hypothetical protein [Paenibacillus lactis]